MYTFYSPQTSLCRIMQDVVVAFFCMICEVVYSILRWLLHFHYFFRYFWIDFFMSWVLPEITSGGRGKVYVDFTLLLRFPFCRIKLDILLLLLHFYAWFVGLFIVFCDDFFIFIVSCSTILDCFFHELRSIGNSL